MADRDVSISAAATETKKPFLVVGLAATMLMLRFFIWNEMNWIAELCQFLKIRNYKLQIEILSACSRNEESDNDSFSDSFSIPFLVQIPDKFAENCQVIVFTIIYESESAQL